MPHRGPATQQGSKVLFKQITVDTRAPFPQKTAPGTWTHLANGVRGQCSGQVLLVGKDEKGCSSQALGGEGGLRRGLRGQPDPSSNGPEQLGSETNLKD